MLFDEGGVTFAYGPQAIHRRENNGPWDLVLGPAEFPDHVNVISIMVERGSGGWLAGTGNPRPSGNAENPTHDLPALFYESMDGIQWSPLPFPDAQNPVSEFPHCYSLISDPLDAVHLYAGLYDGVWESWDSGHSWTKNPNLPGNMVCRRLAMDLADPERLYLAVWDRNPNNGLDPGDGTVYRTEDRGATWTELSGFDPNHPGSYHDVEIDPHGLPPGPSRVWVASLFGARVQMSADGGATWETQVYHSSQVDRQWLQDYCTISCIDLAPDPHEPDRIWLLSGQLIVSEAGGVAGSWHSVTSEDAGQDRWSSRGAGIVVGNVNALSIDPSNPDHIILGIMDPSCAHSWDGGETWGLASDNDHTCAVEGGLCSELTTVVFDPVNKQRLWATFCEQAYYPYYRGCVRESVDGGLTWPREICSETAQSLPSGFKGTLVLDGTDLIVGVEGEGIYRGICNSVSGQWSWFLIIDEFDFDGDGVPEIPKEYVFPSQMVVTPGGRWIVGLAHWYEGGGIVYSDDRGDSWFSAQLNASPLNTTLKDVQDIRLDPSTPDRLYAAVRGMSTGHGGFVKSDDNGTSWTPIADLSSFPGGTTPGQPNPEYLFFPATIEVDPRNPAILYGGLREGVRSLSVPGGLFVSRDYGAHWTKIEGILARDNVSSVRIDPITRRLFVMTAGSGLYIGSAR